MTYPAVTFAANSATAQHTIETENDRLDLGNYKYSVTVEDPVNVGETRTYHRDYAAEEVTVRDNELPNVSVYIKQGRSTGGDFIGVLQNLNSIPVFATEGDAVRFSLERIAPGPALTVNLEVMGADSFVTGALPTTATIAEGQTKKVIAIATANDATVEDHASLTMTVKDGTGYVPGSNPDATWNIYDDDDAELPVLGIQANRPWVNEGEDVVFTITRSSGSGNGPTANVRFLHGRLKGNGVGFLEPIDDVSQTFVAGQDTFTITRTATDDDNNFGDATMKAMPLPGDYYVDVTNPGDSVQTQENRFKSFVRVWVQDDDRPTVTLSPATAEYEEGDRLEVTVARAVEDKPRLRTRANAEITHKYPSPYPDRKVSLPVYPLFIGQGEASSVNSLGRTSWTSGVPSLGATGRIWLVPDDCPDGSAECGRVSGPHYCLDNPGENGGRLPHSCSYHPQYVRGTAYDRPSPSTTTSWGCASRRTRRPWPRARRRRSPCTGRAGGRAAWPRPWKCRYRQPRRGTTLRAPLPGR